MSARQVATSGMARSAMLFAALLIALAAAAFWPQYLGKPWRSIDVYTHAHAALGAAWLLALLAQPLLLRRRQFAAHRGVGRASFVLAPAFVASGVLLAHHRFSRMDATTFAAEAFALYLPLVIAALFATAWSLGVRWRHTTSVHARFMAATGLLLVDPVLARLMFIHLPPLPALPMYQAITFSLIGLVLWLMWRTLPSQAPGRSAFARFAAGTATALALFFVLPYTAAWTAFARTFRSLPLT